MVTFTPLVKLLAAEQVIFLLKKVVVVNDDAVYVVAVAPEISLQVVLSDDDCHWYVKPEAEVAPETLKAGDPVPQ